MPPINRCNLECPGIAAERVLYRYDHLRSSDWLRLRAVARLSIMNAIFEAHAKYLCPERQNFETWQPSERCSQRAEAVMACRPFRWVKLTDHEQEILAPYQVE